VLEIVHATTAIIEIKHWSHQVWPRNGQASTCVRFCSAFLQDLRYIFTSCLATCILSSLV